MREKEQIVLCGPPGTGKTYLTGARGARGDPLFAPDHAFAGVTPLASCPPYSLLTIEVPDLARWLEVCVAAGCCRYGQSIARVWALAVSMLGMVRIAVVLLLLIGVGFYLVRGVVGVPAYYAWVNRRARRVRA
ncbi:hypothetical protein ACVCAH_36920 [Micromonospora sp. LZ34]